MKKILCTLVAAVSLIAVNPAAAIVSAAETNTPALADVNLNKGVIINHYTVKVGLTQVLTGNYAEYGFQGAVCATVKQQGEMILVTGTQPGTVVVDCYLNGVYRTRNYITFKW